MAWPQDYMNWALYSESSDEIIFEELERQFWNIQKASQILLDASKENHKLVMNTDFDNLLKSNEETEWMAGGEEAHMVAQEEIDSSEQIYSFLAPAMCMVSLYIFIEKALKDLCWWYSEMNRNNGDFPRSMEIPAGERFKVKKTRNESQIDANLKFLTAELGIEFNLEEDIANAIELSRNIRNNFAHGDWENVKANLNKLSVQKSLEITALLFLGLCEACGKSK